MFTHTFSNQSLLLMRAASQGMCTTYLIIDMEASCFKMLPVISVQFLIITKVFQKLTIEI